jgi:hypothetical protein
MPIAKYFRYGRGNPLSLVRPGVQLLHEINGAGTPNFMHRFCGVHWALDSAKQLQAPHLCGDGNAATKD